MSIKGKRFIDLQARLDEQISKMVLQLQSKIDLLEVDLKEIAAKYPTNPTVVEKLGRFLPNQPKLRITGSSVGAIVPRNGNSALHLGRPRIIPRWYVEWNDGTKVEFKPNPIRNKIAQLVKNSSSATINFAISDTKQHIIIRVNGSDFQITNPYPDNVSGLKTVNIC